MPKLDLVTGPTREPVPVEEMKDHLRIDIDDDDKLLDKLIRSARAWCEKTQNRAYLTQTWDLYLDDFPDVPLELPYPPLQSVTHIKYYSTADVATEVAETVYRADTYSQPGRIDLKYSQSWPSATLRTMNGVAIRFVAGYTAINKVPEEIKIAVKLLTGHLYENREATAAEQRSVLKEVTLGLKGLLDLDRVMKFV